MGTRLGKRYSARITGEKGDWVPKKEKKQQRRIVEALADSDNLDDTYECGA
jgi:hypothetical protein